MMAYPSCGGWERIAVTVGWNGGSSRDGGLKDTTVGSDGNAFSPSSGIALYRQQKLCDENDASFCFEPVRLFHSSSVVAPHHVYDDYCRRGIDILLQPFMWQQLAWVDDLTP